VTPITLEARLSKGKMRMSPAEWRSGEIAWIIDLIAPFGGGEQALKEVREQVFKYREVNKTSGNHYAK
jgi:cytolysin-activating lysine-acyltransferase